MYLDNIVSVAEWTRDIVKEETEQEFGSQDQLIQNILNRHTKTKPIVVIRRRILQRLRSEIWELSTKGRPDWEVLRSKESPGRLWRPLSYPTIALLLGGCHSAWVKMANNSEKTSKKDLTFA